MISFDEAIAAIRSLAKPVGVEEVSLAEASGRVLAEPVIAQLDSPRCDTSSMDGYAVRNEDLATLPARLTLIGEAFPGAGWSGTIAPSTCVRIFTGAPVPPGSDRIIMQELATRESRIVTVEQQPGPAHHIRSRGSDFARGDELLAAGRLIDPRALVAAAAADCARLQVFVQPRVHILVTGDELARAGTARERPEAVPESVSFALAALVREWGAVCLGCDLLSDELDLLQSRAAAAIADADIVLVAGGASLGERDFAKQMFAPLGMEIIFASLSIKPGKPAWLGRVGQRLIVGLPGNPTSALVTARLLLAPLLARMSGRPVDDALRWKRALLATPLPHCDERETFHRAIIEEDEVHVLPMQESYAQRALAHADILVRQEAKSPPLEPGDIVNILAF